MKIMKDMKNTSRQFSALSNRIIGCAIEVHRHLGPGLLESTYQQCLAHELRINGIELEIEHPLPVVYKDIRLDCGYRIDLHIMRRAFYHRRGSGFRCCCFHQSHTFAMGHLGRRRFPVFLWMGIAAVCHEGRAPGCERAGSAVLGRSRRCNVGGYPAQSPFLSGYGYSIGGRQQPVSW